MATPPQAINIIRADRVVEITWSPDHVAGFPIRMLRCECACASCVDEFTGRRTLDPGTVPEDISITAAAPVGNYAIKFTFTDNHDTGLYTWARLSELCPCERCRIR